MKTVKKNDDIKRVSDEIAIDMINKGWAYVPKKVWKENVRDYREPVKEKIEKVEKIERKEKKSKGKK